MGAILQRQQTDRENLERVLAMSLESNPPSPDDAEPAASGLEDAPPAQDDAAPVGDDPDPDAPLAAANAQDELGADGGDIPAPIPAPESEQPAPDADQPNDPPAPVPGPEELP